MSTDDKIKKPRKLYFLELFYFLKNAGWDWISRVEHLSTSLYRMAKKLERLGLEYHEGEVSYIDTETHQLDALGIGNEL
jgi:hypothetical protein